MADPTPEKPDQPAAAEGAKPEDAGARLNQILSSPIGNPFRPEANPAASAPAASAPTTASETAKALPPDFAAWQGAKPSAPEGEPTSPPGTEPVVASAPPVAQPAGAPPDAHAGRVIAKVRRLMLFSTLLTALAIAAVFGVIGYRVFKSEGSRAPTQATLTLPQGARIVETAIAEDRIVLTIEVGGAREIRTYDVKTLEPLGRLTFGTVP